ncbi:MAG: CAP domain-containing protein [Chitinophagales bacterium]|jgi:uncharacterized protein YkwD|nr:CAP domain-containing protein [Chitinophagales bacterium]
MIHWLFFFLSVCLPLFLSAQAKTSDDALITHTNLLRASQGLKALTPNKNLTDMASAYAAQMGQENFFSHYHPTDASLKNPGMRAKLSGYDFGFIAENIALYESKTELDLDSLALIFYKIWENSPKHKKNMLSLKAQEIGCGIYKIKRDKFYVYYGVQNFGTQKSQITLSKSGSK